VAERPEHLLADCSSVHAATYPARRVSQRGEGGHGSRKIPVRTMSAAQEDTLAPWVQRVGVVASRRAASRLRGRPRDQGVTSPRTRPGPGVPTQPIPAHTDSQPIPAHTQGLPAMGAQRKALARARTRYRAIPRTATSGGATGWRAVPRRDAAAWGQAEAWRAVTGNATPRRATACWVTRWRAAARADWAIPGAPTSQRATAWRAAARRHRAVPGAAIQRRSSPGRAVTRRHRAVPGVAIPGRPRPGRAATRRHRTVPRVAAPGRASSRRATAWRDSPARAGGSCWSGICTRAGSPVWLRPARRPYPVPQLPARP
jgi:hypothetical protein